MLRVHGIEIKEENRGRKNNGSNNAPAPVVNAAAEPKGKFVFRTSLKVPEVPKLGRIMVTAEDQQKQRDDFAKFKTEVAEAMPSYVEQLAAFEKMDGELKALNEPMSRELMGAIAQMLSYPEPFLSVAVLIYAREMAKHCAESRSSVDHLIGALKSAGFITDAKPKQIYGVVKVYDGTYTLANGFAKSPEAREVLNALAALAKKASAAGRIRFEANLADLKAKAGDNQITIADLVAGNPGKILLQVPDSDTGSRFYAGGPLLVESADKKVRPLGAAGALAMKANDLVAAGTFLHVDQIKRETLTYPQTMTEEQRRNVYILWRWVHNTVVEAEKQAKCEAAENAWKAQLCAEYETLAAQRGPDAPTYDEFFRGEKPGRAILYLDEPFKWFGRDETGKSTPVETINGFMVLIERRDNGDIRVADCPERLKKFLAECGDFTAPGEKFSGLPKKLAVLLRRGFGIAVNAYNKAQRAAQSTAPEADGETAEPEVSDAAAEAAAIGVDPTTIDNVEVVAVGK
jgi:hypothetical protein